MLNIAETLITIWSKELITYLTSGTNEKPPKLKLAPAPTFNPISDTEADVEPPNGPKSILTLFTA